LSTLGKNVISGVHINLFTSALKFFISHLSAYLKSFSYALFQTSGFLALSYQKTDGVNSSISKFLIISIFHQLLYAIAEFVVHRSIPI